MPVWIDTVAIEKSSIAIQVDFVDESGEPFIPKTIAWTLTDNDGIVINGRDQIPITPASPLYVVLSGDDLSLPSGEDEIRRLTVEAVYDSTFGNDLPLKESAVFGVRNLRAVT